MYKKFKLMILASAFFVMLPGFRGPASMDDLTRSQLVFLGEQLAEVLVRGPAYPKSRPVYYDSQCWAEESVPHVLLRNHDTGIDVLANASGQEIQTLKRSFLILNGDVEIEPVDVSDLEEHAYFEFQFRIAVREKGSPITYVGQKRSGALALTKKERYAKVFTIDGQLALPTAEERKDLKDSPVKNWMAQFRTHNIFDEVRVIKQECAE